MLYRHCCRYCSLLSLSITTLITEQEVVHGRRYHSPSITPGTVLGCSQLGSLRIKLLQTFPRRVCVNTKLPFLCDKRSSVQVLGCMAITCLVYKKLPSSFQGGRAIFPSHPQCVSDPVSSPPRLRLLCHSFLFQSSWWVNRDTSLPDDAENLFVSFLAIYISASVKCLFRSFTHFLIGLFVF